MSLVPILDPKSHAARMLAYLRDVFRARGMRYADIAALLAVSEKTVKRYMAGRGVTLPTLERLCAAVGLSLSELSELSLGDDEREPSWTTEDQEAVLAAEPRLAMVLALLTSGWTAGRIEREGLTSRADMNSILVRLDRLGVITLYPNNRTRLRARIRPISTASEPLRRVISEAGARIIKGLDLADPAALWRINYARLGPASVARAATRLEAFLNEVAELSRQDMDLSGENVRWYAVCGVLTEHEALGLRLLRDEQGAGQSAD